MEFQLSRQSSRGYGCLSGNTHETAACSKNKSPYNKEMIMRLRAVVLNTGFGKLERRMMPSEAVGHNLNLPFSLAFRNLM